HVSVWTSDPKLAMKLSNSFRAGTVCVNDVIFTLAEIECPWGGMGLSGMGKMHGEYGLRESCFIKHISYDDGKRRSMPWWFPYDERYRNLMLASLSGGHGMLPDFLPRWRDFLSRRLR
ncbi:TPA: aldehyde dehydrogenase family protein, partial [Candidatus Poribacteria bacterium]|nr:aldehyde dehydrogenase family protein [Candidatus Poribacteria bacterium]HEX29946.1 aldehyde dehydrogenase family protein [Candidatus Poribacteria bacterium]